MSQPTMLPDQPNTQWSTDRAVSPVIGVILMVAITVILAAVIGTFVLGLGDSVSDKAPQATLSVSAKGGTIAEASVTIEHQGGDALHADRTRILVESDSGSITVSPTSTDSTFSVGGTSTFDTHNAIVTGWGYSSSEFSATLDFDAGESVAITLVDTGSQKVVYETEVTAA